MMQMFIALVWKIRMKRAELNKSFCSETLIYWTEKLKVLDDRPKTTIDPKHLARFQLN